MPIQSIPFRDTNYFSSFICDYIEKHPNLKEFYHRYPTIENLEEQIKEKGASFAQDHREVLFSELQKQYKGFAVTDTTESNLELLTKENTFTITTGHQLNLFTGPLYFLYKIVSTINLTRILKEKYPAYNFVPIYWMATEDHDFDEINYFNLKSKKIQWNRSDGGAVGGFDTEGLQQVFDVFAAEIGIGKNADYLKKLFETAYVKHNNLSAATRYLANELFGKYGLVIVDADAIALKKIFIPYMEQELINQTAYQSVVPQTEKLSKKGYKIQVNPREINLFYLSKESRERIVLENGVYSVLETDIRWTKEELLAHLNESPESFSPNVMMRPLYQEVILPNLCYIGGGGELAYWLELKTYFEEVQVPFPMLLLRNSVLIQNKKQCEKIEKLQVVEKELFLKSHELINRKVRQISNIDIDLSKQRTHLQEQFVELYELAKQTDNSFVNAVKAQEVKQLKGLDMLEQRLLKAQRIKLKDQVKRLTELQNELFPNHSLQERTNNFSELYLELGEDLIPLLIDTLNPLSEEFLIIKNEF